MIIELNFAQKKLLMETLAIAHAMQGMQNKDATNLEKLIGILSDALDEQERNAIINSVFQEYKP